MFPAFRSIPKSNIAAEDMLAGMLDQPFFLIKAQDKLAIMAIAAWIEAAERAKVNPEKIKGAEQDMAAIQQFQMDHPERCKIPD
jgi:hypothetical protein